MRLRLLSVVAIAGLTAMPALAIDTSSLAGFVQDCSGDSKACHSMVLNAVISARNANYGCIPKDVSNDAAADKLLDWLKQANKDPKYAKDALADLMWTGIDEIWPCKK